MAGLGPKELTQAKGVVAFSLTTAALVLYPELGPRGCGQPPPPPTPSPARAGWKTVTSGVWLRPVDASTWYIIDGASNCVFPKVYRLLMKNSWHASGWQGVRSIGSAADKGVQGPSGTTAEGWLERGQPSVAQCPPSS